MKNPNDVKLLALRIPTGWGVKYNTFNDELPLNEDGTPNRMHNDSPDLIWLQQLHGIHDNQWTTEPEHLINIDAGWHYLPLGTTNKSRAKGCYKLTAYRDRWNHIIRQVYCPDKDNLAQTIEAWLKEVAVTGDLKP